ncbi:MAG TPA: diguanylate cyclase [Galbitalea sp.]|nr:diguanylate cyclase [Galbitalea sp.]
MDSVLSDALPSGLLLIDARRQILAVNELVLKWCGVPREKLIGQPFDSVVVQPEGARSADSEYLPAIAEITLADGSILPVLVAEGEADVDGNRYLTLFDAREQREFRQRLATRHTMTVRTQTRLELVIAASIAFAEASDEDELAGELAKTMASAYAAEEAVVFLLDEDMVFREAAGSNPLNNMPELGSLTAQALQLRTVTKISGIEEAYAVAPAIGAAFEATGVQSIIIAPIHHRDLPLGIVAAFFHHPRTFDDQAAPLADALAGQAQRAISALRAQKRLEHAAMHDDTTGLPNRRMLEERADSTPRQRSAVIGVLFVDLDAFKVVNDELGHDVGDAVLREVGVRLQSTIREQDIVARYGGDEFVIVCEVSNEEVALELAERVRESIGRPYGILPEGFRIAASIGVSVMHSESGDVGTSALLRAADEAMYRAKHAGGDQIAFVVSGVTGAKLSERL